MPAPAFHLIPHTHWDREWYLTRSAFQARLVPVLDAVIEELERDADARFLLDGQTILLEDYLAVKPAQESRIAALVRRGALEIGPWYVLADLLIPAGASLRRNLAEGARDCARFGGRLDVLYSPDAFGHPAELPALAAEFGICRAVVRRGVGRPDGVDRDFYRWTAPSGESVLAYHLPASGYDLAVGLAAPVVDLEPAWRAIRTELTARAVTSQVAVFLGADHHAMPTDVVRLARLLQALEPDYQVRVSGLREFFDAVEATNPAVPLLKGELRSGDGHAWVLPGVHSARSRLKRHHTQVELLLSRVAEPLADAARAAGGADRSDLIRHAWRALLQSQFHDTLAGTTSDPVQKEQEVRLESVEAVLREVGRGALAELAAHDPDRARDFPAKEPSRLVQWNPGTRRRERITTAELDFFRRDVLVGPPGGRVPMEGPGFRGISLSAGNAVIPVQVLGIRGGQVRNEAARHYPDQDEVDRTWIAFRPPPLDAGATHVLTPRSRPIHPAHEGLSASSATLGNRAVRVGIGATGELVLDDLAAGRRHTGLAGLVLTPEDGDLYTASPGTSAEAPEWVSVAQSVIANGPLIGSVETRWEAWSRGERAAAIRQLVVLHADSPIVRVRLDIELEAANCRLRARFPAPGVSEVLAGTGLGSITRPIEARLVQHPLEHLPPAAPAHRYVAMQTTGLGLAVLAPAFFEYSWDEAAGVSVTLLRAVGELSLDGLPERPGHAAWPIATPEAQEKGRHTIHLAVVPMPAAEARDPARLEELWEEAFLPVQSWWLGRPE